MNNEKQVAGVLSSITKEAINKASQVVIPACRESRSESPRRVASTSRKEGLRTSRNDRKRDLTNGFLCNSGHELIALLFIMILPVILIPFRHVSAAEKKIPESHPIELPEKPRCTECHIDDTGVALKPISGFVHGSDWIQIHRFYASQTHQLCNACHKVSFCLDCHAYKGELKPSDKYSGSVDRWLPHRGDYLFQHRIDGRIDPASCFRCHGRQNNRTCKRCHK